jgi:hypothetical protein
MNRQDAEYAKFFMGRQGPGGRRAGTVAVRKARLPRSLRSLAMTRVRVLGEGGLQERGFLLGEADCMKDHESEEL